VSKEDLYGLELEYFNSISKGKELTSNLGELHGALKIKELNKGANCKNADCKNCMFYYSKDDWECGKPICISASDRVLVESLLIEWKNSTLERVS